MQTAIRLSHDQLTMIRATMRAQAVSQATVGRWLQLGQGRVSERLLGKKPFQQHQLVTLATRLGLGDLLALVAEMPDATQRHQHQQGEVLRCLAETLRALSPAQMDELLLCLAVVLQGQGAVAHQASRVLRGLVTRRPAAVVMALPRPALAPLDALDTYCQEAAVVLATPA